jgi:hypothetical protein
LNSISNIPASHTEQDIPSRARFSANTETPTCFPHGSFSSEFNPLLDHFPHMSSQSFHGGTFNVIGGNLNSTIQHQGEFGEPMNKSRYLPADITASSAILAPRRSL